MRIAPAPRRPPPHRQLRRRPLPKTWSGGTPPPSSASRNIRRTFTHFDYVNPDAPKGGVVRLSDTGGFDTLNPILPKGNPAPGLGLVYETLMTPSLDEASTMYGLIAEAMSWPDDYSSVTFRLRPEAKWQDGEPITAEDVVWSFNKMVELNPSQKFYYQHVTKAEVTGEHEVTFTFDQTGNRELPNIVGQLHRAAKALVGGQGRERPAAQYRQLDARTPLWLGPLPRGAHRSRARRSSTERNDDYWAKDLPIGIGQDNFDEIRYRGVPRRHGRVRGLQGRRLRLARRELGEALGDAVRFPGGAEGLCRQGGAGERLSRQWRDGRASSPTSGGISSRTSACAGR